MSSSFVGANVDAAKSQVNLSGQQTGATRDTGIGRAEIVGAENRRPASRRAFKGRKPYGQCADGHRTLSSTAV